MLMTTPRLILLRLFNMTVGRWSWGSKFLRKILLKKLVHSKKNPQKYTASSHFFEMRELDRD